jgi:ribosomal protein S18 acetylase RimI-like enzyme
VLRKVSFDESWLDRVRDFHCGDDPWDLEVSDWIKDPNPGGALDHLKKGRCDVWLYLNDGDDVAGFSSLGSTKWKYPTSEDPKAQLNLIPNVAVASAFQGQGFFKMIMGHLYHEAKQKTDRLPLIGLFVHPSNEDAIGIYHYLGFADFYHFYEDKQTKVVYRSMVRKLPD